MIKHLYILVLFSTILVGCSNTDMLAGDVYSASEIKQMKNVSYGTLVSIRPVKIQISDENNVINAIKGAILGGFLGKTIGGGTGRDLATAGGVVLGGTAAQNTLNKIEGIELEVRKDDGHIIAVVQKKSDNRYFVGQRVALISDGNQITISPR